MPMQFPEFLFRFIGFLICLYAAIALSHTPAYPATPVPHERENHGQAYDKVWPPTGWIEMCAREKDKKLCADDPDDRVVVLNFKSMKQLVDVNAFVNKTIEQWSDPDHYHRDEFWTLPKDDKGDCEDIVLLKREMLHRLGFPYHTLIITVGIGTRDNGRSEGHAVLSVWTTKGWLVLDSMTDAILPPGMTTFTFTKRQSRHDPNKWVWWGDDDNA